MIIPNTSLTCFFFNDTATTEIYTLSLHDALPISDGGIEDLGLTAKRGVRLGHHKRGAGHGLDTAGDGDRKSTRLNSSHSQISYAVFCLKKKKYLQSSRPQLNDHDGSTTHSRLCVN